LLYFPAYKLSVDKFSRGIYLYTVVVSDDKWVLRTWIFNRSSFS